MKYRVTFIDQLAYLEADSLAYDLDKKHEPGKKYTLDVRVDVDGTGRRMKNNSLFSIGRLFITRPKKNEVKNRTRSDKIQYF